MDPDPDPATTFCWLTVIVLAIFTFLVSLADSSAAAISEKKIREDAEDGDKKAKRLVKLWDKQSKTTDTAIVFTILASALSFALVMMMYFMRLTVFYAMHLPATKQGLVGEVADATLCGYLALLTLVLVFVITFTSICVVFPRKYGSQHCDKIAPALSGFLLFIRAVLTPLTVIITAIAHLFVLIFGGDPKYDDDAVTEDEILSMVDEGEESGVIEESQKEMINNIFEFDDLVAGDVMTHRTHMEAVEASEDIVTVVEKAITEGYSRLPVYEDDLDNIKGILYVKDLLKYVGTSAPTYLKPSDIMREATFVPQSKKCRDLFSEMTEKHVQMVIVADEYGGVAGIVTIEDLIESIMGNIQDEFDDEQEEIEQISEDIFNIEGTSAIEDVEELLDIEFPEGEYDTVAGYIMSVLGRIPEADEHPIVEHEGFGFMVAEMDDRRIVRIIVERLPEETEEA
jgi:putative hemolysin